MHVIRYVLPKVHQFHVTLFRVNEIVLFDFRGQMKQLAIFHDAQEVMMVRLMLIPEEKKSKFNQIKIREKIHSNN